ncbi:DUF3387 domain-containing protein [Escherichia coli]|uniref:DUF3387 domain-containing protein n=1 Tax=Escherichia coli TaxID=562 RepID=A0A8S7F7R2_ECOLX|nr:DUF3387 domain-containing protein [Escherichia coli]EFL3126753.1 DUF3387 domain-containing protein [Escherichia coli]EGM8186517.1 DUF3387 domain-containing protein [Escherichia coli]EHC1946316.1 DUF3387 domain-containing protein [Escherichia coli]EIP9526125.1 DUF3387 domain-containing protein [Escherichia coli]
MVASAGFDYTSFKAHARKSLMPVAYYGFGSEDGKKRFLNNALEITTARLLCCCTLNAVKAAISKITRVDKNKPGKNHTLKQILDNVVISDGLNDIFTRVALDKPNIGLNFQMNFFSKICHIETWRKNCWQN